MRDLAETPEGFDPVAFWEKRLEPFDLSAVGYAGLGLRYNEWLYRVRSFAFRRALADVQLDLDGARVLDVGSGTGFYVREWLAAGAEAVVGSDLTSTATGRLKGVFPRLEFVQFDISAEPPFDRASFDVISAFDVLFHIVEDARYRAAISNFSGLLRRGGLLFFSENFVHGDRSKHVHMVSRSRAEIEDLLRHAGLEIVTRRPMFIIMNAPVDSESALHQRLWRQFARVVSRHEGIGATAGALLFPLEIALISFFREGPSAEVMVCRKT